MEIPEIERNWEEEYKDLLFHPDFDIDELRNPDRRWVLSIDLSEGGGKRTPERFLDQSR